MASLDFTDATGAATLSNGLTGPPARFANWTPDVIDVGPSDVAAGGGETSQFWLRTDYLVRLELPHVPASALAVAQRLKRHLGQGGVCTVTTGDLDARTYTCRLAPRTTVEIDFTDRRRLRYTVRCQLKHTVAAPLICLYPLG